MKIRNLCFLLVLVLTLSLPLVGCQNDATQNPSSPSDTTTNSIDMDKLLYFLGIFEQNSLQGFPEGTDLTAYIIQALLSASPDRYDGYFTPEAYGDYTSQLAGDVYGIGVLVAVPQEDACEWVQILDVFDNSGAAEAGLLPGDKIYAIDGVSFQEKGYTHTIEKLTGTMGSSVSLSFKRGESDEMLTCAPVRGKYTRNTVYSYQKGDIGYVRITTFETVTTSQFISHVSRLEEAGVKGFVFDLRGNGGGLLRTVCEMLAYLLPDGKIGSVNYANENLEDYEIYSKNGKLYMGDGGYAVDSNGGALHIDHVLTVPCAVLTDKETASASELFTKALKDTSEAGDFVPVTLVGQNTYGKGTMQTTFSLKDGSYVKMTVAEYNPPCGINYDGVGIAPDHPMEETLSSNALYLIAHEEDVVRVTAFQLLTQNQT